MAYINEERVREITFLSLARLSELLTWSWSPVWQTQVTSFLVVLLLLFPKTNGIPGPGMRTTGSQHRGAWQLKGQALLARCQELRWLHIPPRVRVRVMYMLIWMCVHVCRNQRSLLDVFNYCPSLMCVCVSVNGVCVPVQVHGGQRHAPPHSHEIGSLTDPGTRRAASKPSCPVPVSRTVLGYRWSHRGTKLFMQMETP